MYGKPLLRCNDCNGEMRIIDTRVLEPDRKDHIYRRRKYQCLKCKCKVSTLEELHYMHIERLKDENRKLEISQGNV